MNDAELYDYLINNDPFIQHELEQQYLVRDSKGIFTLSQRLIMFIKGMIK